MPSLFHVIILSIVEGLTEFLPISSTAHLVLTSKLLNIPQTDFIKSFEIAIQLGAILSVFVLYLKKITSMPSLLFKTLIAFVPSVLVGLVFYEFIKSTLIGNIPLTLLTLSIGGLFLIFLDRFIKPKNKVGAISLSPKKLLIIGLFQSISVVPGVSRAAATIIGGLYVGLPKKDAVEFSFLLAIPTMLAATVLDLSKNFRSFTPNQFSTLTIGFIFSFITALVSIKLLLGFVKNHSFAPFGFYRILLAIIFAMFFL